MWTEINEVVRVNLSCTSEPQSTITAANKEGYRYIEYIHTSSPSIGFIIFEKIKPVIKTDYIKRHIPEKGIW